MNLLTVILFFVTMYGLGYSVSAWRFQPKDGWEKHCMRLGFGLATFPVLAVVLNALNIPLDWKIFLALSMIVPVVMLIKNKKTLHLAAPQLKLTQTNLRMLALLVIVLASFFLYHKGSFAYPWLEDADPWYHALGAKYIAEVKTAEQPFDTGNINTRVLEYIDPYPPAYDILLGILHQTAPDLNWTLKFFNALIISLGFLFFYFFANTFMHNQNKALFATFVLAALPSYLSHFIWAHALAMTVFFPLLYALIKICEDKRWAVLAALFIASEFMITPTKPIKFTVMIFIYILIKSIYSKKIQWVSIAAYLGGVILSLVWWLANVKSMFTTGIEGHMLGKTVSAAPNTILSKLGSMITKVFPPDSGTATRPYTFDDFFIAQSQNLINNPVGLGSAITLLGIVSIVVILFQLRKFLDTDNEWKVTALLWFIFTFLLVNSLTFHLPIGFYGFRGWMLMAIPLSLLSAEGIWFLRDIVKKMSISQSIQNIIANIGIGVVCIAIIVTAWYPKYQINTSLWPTDPFSSVQELYQNTNFFLSLPPNTHVFSMYDGFKSRLMGLNMYSCEWCRDVWEYRQSIYNRTPKEIHAWLKSKNYAYAMIDFMYVRDWEQRNVSTNTTVSQMNALVNSEQFITAHRSEERIVLQVI